MTEKIYYKDAYIKEFTAAVLSCEPAKGGFDIVLDRTAFFPEEGGQYADGGTLSGIAVLDVKEKHGVIHHYTAEPIALGEVCSCKIDFSERFEKMQCHTAEHILSGLFHKHYAIENVGFHLGRDIMTMDISVPLEKSELLRIEELANIAVFNDLSVKAYFPTEDELSVLEYRSKLALTENIRIVEIGDVDVCACCAPHVAHTGEIGLIKITDAVKMRGGMRLTVAAGKRAYRLVSKLFSEAGAVSAMLSVPRLEIAEGVRKLSHEASELRSKLSECRAREIERCASELLPTEGNAVVLLSGYTIPEMITYSNTALSRVGGILVLLSGEDGDYKYVISSKTENLRTVIAEINKSLLGRGGGKPEMVQGSFASGLSDIKNYFGG